MKIILAEPIMLEVENDGQTDLEVRVSHDGEYFNVCSPIYPGFTKRFYKTKIIEIKEKIPETEEYRYG